MRNINRIVVHCAATKPSMNIGANKIREWHLDRGWRDIGYHYVIRRDGTVERGRPEEEAGAHVRGFNANTIGICLVGGMDAQGGAAVNYTDQQYLMLDVLLRGIKGRYDKDVDICGHNDLTTTKTCPNFDVRAWCAERHI